MTQKNNRQRAALVSARALQKRALDLGFVLQHSGGYFELYQPVHGIHNAAGVKDFLDGVARSRERRAQEEKASAITIVTAELAAAAYPKKREHKSCLTHAVELADGSPVRVLCDKVKVKHILDDEALYTDEEPTCTECARLKPLSAKRKGDPAPEGPIK